MELSKKEASRPNYTCEYCKCTFDRSHPSSATSKRDKARTPSAALATFLLFFAPFCYVLGGFIRNGIESFDLHRGSDRSGGGASSGGLFLLLFTGVASCFLLFDLIRIFRRKR